MTGYWQVQSCADLVPITTVFVIHIYNDHVTPEIQHSMLLPSGPSDLAIFLILGCLLNLENGKIDVLFLALRSIVTHSLHHDQLWVSAVTTDQCKKNLLLPKWTVALVYRHKHSYLGENLAATSCPFSKNKQANDKTIASQVGPVVSLAMSLWSGL